MDRFFEELTKKHGKPIKTKLGKKNVLSYVVVKDGKVVAVISFVTEKPVLSDVSYIEITDGKQTLSIKLRKGSLTYDKVIKLYKQAQEKEIKQEGYLLYESILGFLRKHYETLSLVMSFLAAILLIIIYVVSLYRMGKITYKAGRSTVLSRNIDAELFKGQTGYEPEFQVYAQLINYIDVVCKSKRINGLIVCGPPGTGKTYIVKRTLYFKKINYVYDKGGTDSLFTLYSIMAEHPNKVIVLDDFDVEWNDSVIGFIKAATDTSPKRIVSNPETLYTISSQEVASLPRRTVFTGKLILLTNKAASDIPLPVKSRVPVIEVKFSMNEMINIIQKMMKYIGTDVPMSVKQEVFSYLLSLVKENKLKRIDFRTFEIALDLRQNFPAKWKQIFLKTIEETL